MNESARTRVAIFMSNLNGGGFERMMLNLGEEFLRRGLSLDLVLASNAGDYHHIVPAGADVVDLRCKSTGRALLPLAQYLRKRRPDALLCGLVHVNVVAVLAGKLSGAPTRIVISERNTPSQDRRSPNYTQKVGYALAPFVYPRADSITAVSEGVARDMAAALRIPSTRIRALKNPVVNGSIRAQAEQPFDHPWLADTRSVPVILAAGRLAPQKNYPNLLHAFSHVRAERPVRLLILGQGGELEALQAQARDLGCAEDVCFYGFAQNPYAAMSRADLFVLSSDWEGSPNVLVEAMTFGTPVVSTDCPSGPREILDGGRYGPLVPVGDPTALAAAMIATLNAPPAPDALRDRARLYDAAVSADAYLSVLLPDRIELLGEVA